MDILEANKLIHEFMGWRWFDKRYPRNHGIGAPEAWEGTNDIIIQKAKYHSSWDWLMPVVEKIGQDNDCSLEAVKLWTEIKDSLLSIDIKKVHTSVIQFIQRYTTQSTKPNE